MKKNSTMDSKNKHTTKAGKMCICASCPGHCKGWGLMLLRLVVGAIFILAGWPKILGMPVFFGLHGLIGSAVGVVEVLAGIALVVGIWTRWAGYALATVMAVAIIGVHLQQGWGGIRFPLTLFASAFVLAWNGPGKWSLHEKCGCCKE